jgi:hypothetical protein
MRTKAGLLILTIVLAGAFALPTAMAAPKKETTEAAEAPRAGQVTHAELARILVNLLALARFLPAEPSAQECIAILLQNRIVPPEGWQPDAVVTKGDLAVVLVKALRQLGEEIDFDPNDTKAAIAFLKEQGIPFDTIGEGVAAVRPLPNPIAPYVFSPTTDPLKKHSHFGEPDEVEYGADAERSFANRPVRAGPEIVQVITPIPAPSKGGGGPTRFRP